MKQMIESQWVPCRSGQDERPDRSHAPAFAARMRDARSTHRSDAHATVAATPSGLGARSRAPEPPRPDRANDGAMSVQHSVKPEDLIAEAFLRAISAGATIARPAERVSTPDLLVGDSVAVEVRPLAASARGMKSFEEVRKPTIALLRKAIADQNADRQRAKAKVTLAITLRPVRPMPAEETLRSELDRALGELRARGRDGVVRLDCGVVLEAAKVTFREGAAFTYAGTSDPEATRSVVATYVEAIRRCLDDATERVAKARDRHPTWWLLMVDLIDCPLTRAEVTAVEDELGSIGLFDRVMVVHPSSGLLLRLDGAPATPPPAGPPRAS